MSENLKNTSIENTGRRKAVKTIVGGVTAIAAYNVLPSKWGTPIIEQVFLPAHAATSSIAYEYVGSWNVGDGPAWGLNPPTYTGQEAAALIFGGNAEDYAISTVSNQVEDINFQSYSDTYGALPGDRIQSLAQDVSVDSGNSGYDQYGDTSAYVTDHREPAVNYAFRIIS